MEYIREMLLRQRTALARLMLGAGGRDTAEASSAPAHAGETDLPESGAGRRTAASGGRENARRAGGQQAVTAAAAMGGPPSAGETLRRALARKSAARRAAAPFGLTGVGGIVRSGRSRRGTGSDAADRSSGAGAAGPAGEEAESAVLTAEFRRPVEAGAGESARALSRAVQRDARRYDGGFRLYE